MEGEGEVEAVQSEGKQDQQPAGIPIGSPEWYFRASALYSELLINSELERIFQYTADVDTHAHNLAALWMTDPFPRDLFIQEAVRIVERSDAVEEQVTTLKNTIVRFMHAGNPDEKNVSRSRKRRRHHPGRRSTPITPPNQDPGQQDGGTP